MAILESEEKGLYPLALHYTDQGNYIIEKSFGLVSVYLPSKDALGLETEVFIDMFAKKFGGVFSPATDSIEFYPDCTVMKLTSLGLVGTVFINRGPTIEQVVAEWDQNSTDFYPEVSDLDEFARMVCGKL